MYLCFIMTYFTNTASEGITVGVILAIIMIMFGGITIAILVWLFYKKKKAQNRLMVHQHTIRNMYMLQTHLLAGYNIEERKV